MNQVEKTTSRGDGVTKRGSIRGIWSRVQSRLVSETRKEHKDWRDRGYQEPSPHSVKMKCLSSKCIPGALWIETGTYLGQTTEVLSKMSRRVISIEPSPELYSAAVQKFIGIESIELVNDISENAFPKVLPEICEPVNFWLDGHFSSGNTFQGPSNTPIAEELNEIEKHIKRFGRVAIFIDDVRLFGLGNNVNHGYPPLDYLVDWSRRCGLHWRIEHDIFIAVSPETLSS